MRRKPILVYLTPDERQRFETFAQEHKQSISNVIKSLAISSISQSNAVIPDNQESKIEFLESRLKFLEEERSLPKDTYQRISREIFNLLNIEWKSLSDIISHFNISSEEENDDFNIGLHIFQENYEGQYEFNGFKNAYRRK